MLARFNLKKYRYLGIPNVSKDFFYATNHSINPENLLLQEETRRVLLLIRTFKEYGHLVASTDPLQTDVKLPTLHRLTHGNRILEKPTFEDINIKLFAEGSPLMLESHGFTTKDLEREFFIGEDLSIGPVATLHEILTELRLLFCGNIGTEYLHLYDRDACKWIRKQLELYHNHTFSKDEKLEFYQQMLQAELFEKFLGRRFSGAKRFSIEGGESLIPGLNTLFNDASNLGVECILMGMAHRGRLNVLANVLKRPLQTILSQFQSYLPDEPEYPNNSDDVRYHLGATSNIKMRNGKFLEVRLVSNPSHLEAVNPVVLGSCRAKQTQTNDISRKRVMPILLHGDAAMFLGSVREAFGFSTLEDYRTGGTIHVIINNQIGFTTLPKEADSALYCSDVAKITKNPVFHVNGDNPEAVAKVMKMAISFRQKYSRDVVIDLVCYRRHGHNEQDSPEITAPIMYHHISNHPTTLESYQRKLEDQHILKSSDSESLMEDYKTALRTAHEKSLSSPSPWNNLGAVEWRNEWLDHDHQRWYPVQDPDLNDIDTGSDKIMLEALGQQIFRLPQGFSPHLKVEAVMNNRFQAVEKGSRLDWGAAEALAIASLLVEGYDVRLSGQDCERGTFNQRHAVLYDQVVALKGKHQIHIPLQSIDITGLPRCYLSGSTSSLGKFDICNSPLSEEGVLGFEYGISLQRPEALTLWEAQFGDFANGAQTIIDTFIVSGEQKWLHESGLVMLLPHGYEGQGPEHSSARVERFLQMVNEDPDVFQTDRCAAEKHANIHVVMPTTPAQYFHVLRRQMKRKFRKPLIVFTPKYLLHHRPCNSELLDISTGTSYVAVMPVHPDDAKTMVPNDEISVLVICSGKIYYHLINMIRAKGIKTIATARIEQLSPFPFVEIATKFKKYENAKIIWLQEEPKNMGSWSYCLPRLHCVLRHLNRMDSVEYIGRSPSASPATGQYELHNQEMKQILDQVLAEANKVQ